VLAEPSASAAVTSADGSANAVAEGGAAGTVVETVHSAPDAPLVAETAASGVAVGPLQLKASEQSWVEVVDARSQILFSRMLLPGETVVLDGALPLRIKVGNVAATQLTYRGVAVDLAASTRDNVARLELK
jgi:cytoskeleton protein RodZ